MTDRIDLTYIYDIADGNHRFVLTLLDILEKNLLEYPVKMSRELSEGNMIALRESAHKFKSCTAYTGVNEFNHTLEAIELGVDNQAELAEIRALVNKITTYALVLNQQVTEITAEIKQKAEQDI